MKRTYEENIHIWGRIWIVSALLMMLLVPLVISVVNQVWPDPVDFLKGFIASATIFWAVTTIEVFTFSPMLGNGGTYLGFVTGNLTNLKVPAALNAMKNLDVNMGSEKGDVISTIAIASSSIITTIIIFVGAMILIPITPLLEADVLQPAFTNVIPALFGALGLVYISKNWKMAIVPVVIMIVLFMSIPNSGYYIPLFIPVGVIITIITARLLYRKKKI
jgi:hypothetical protein